MKEEPKAAEKLPEILVDTKNADIRILAPVQGKAYNLSKVPDEVFASGALGKGIGILPAKGEVVAPADATVSVLYPTLHAMGLLLDNGVELLIHIGMDTVQMNGEGFKKAVNQGDKVKKGALLVEFDIEKIKAAGHDTTVSIVVSNGENFAGICGVEAEKADNNTEVILIKK